MPIPDPPPEPTYYRVLLSDPEGTDPDGMRRLLEDCGLRIVRLEELSAREMEEESGAAEKRSPQRDLRMAG